MQPCPPPRVSLQLPKEPVETWSSGGAAMVIKVEIEPLLPRLTVSPGVAEAVSVRGLPVLAPGKPGRRRHARASAQAGLLRCQR